MHTVDISFLQTQDGYRFMLFFSLTLKPHSFSVASYMPLHVQDFRGRRYTGPDIQSRPVYYAMEIHTTKWQMLNDMNLHSFAFFGRPKQIAEGMICFYQAKEDLCVCLRWREPD